MKKSNFKRWIVIGFLGLAGLSAMACSGSMAPANGNGKVNGNATANVATATGANDPKPEASKLEQKPDAATTTTGPAKNEKGDCTLKEDNAEFFISATEKTVKLKKATPIKYVMFGNQGLAVVEAQIDGKWVKGEMQDALLDCPDDGKDEPTKK